MILVLPNLFVKFHCLSLKIWVLLPFSNIGHGQGGRRRLHHHTTPTVAFPVRPLAETYLPPFP
jgi:hypothetical protein